MNSKHTWHGKSCTGNLQPHAYTGQSCHANAEDYSPPQGAQLESLQYLRALSKGRLDGSQNDLPEKLRAHLPSSPQLAFLRLAGA